MVLHDQLEGTEDTVVIDEIQRLPELFDVPPVLVDHLYVVYPGDATYQLDEAITCLAARELWSQCNKERQR